MRFRNLETAILFAQDAGFEGAEEAVRELGYLKEVEKTAHQVMEATFVFPGHFPHVGSLRALVEEGLEGYESAKRKAAKARELKKEREAKAVEAEQREYARLKEKYG